jgi:acyl-[acyl-carrier-protein]-phospholipid O-acyltransferase/long-chain-fatty-acid--[acyl-carrier-protein] ligase
MFNSLPMFHSFGLTIGTIFPLLAGAKVFEFPSPLLYRSITELLYEVRATIMVATDTFFKAYAKISHPYDFRHIRYCYAGAEAVKEDTRKMVAENLGCRLLEGYGTTECSPIVCVNTLLFNKFGTLGRLAPAMEYRIEKIQGINEGGELVVKGPNVMKGYIYADNPGVVVPVKDGWYHTGDVVVADELGFIKIVDRVKRFAKVGGEMVSLLAIENAARDTWKDEEFQCGVVAVPHPSKGEQIVFTSNSKDITKEQFSKIIQQKGLSELYTPSIFLYKEEMPVLSTGKADNISLKKWVLEELKL